MGFFDKMSKKMGLDSSDDDTQEQGIEEKFQKESQKESPFMRTDTSGGIPGGINNVVSLQSVVSAREGAISVKMKVIVIEPKGFDDAQQVANCMREKRPVVINFEHTEPEAAKRIIDFISGTTYALNGEIKKVGKHVFLCAPSNVNVTYTEEEKKVSTDMPWLNK